ncbi:MAG: glycoside hydrolase family 57 protein [Bryobacteraceae bacterium]
MTRLCFLWHMHQPFYKDLWTGEYKLPWTRLHALKDYPGMVRILAEFPQIHQTFNLVPSMVTQIAEYAEGKASDPFFDCAVMPAESLTDAQRTFAWRYFFQANVDRIIRRYPRYGELYDRRHERPSVQDLRDLQIFSQLAWMDEDVLARDEELREIIKKGREYSRSDQEMMTRKQREMLAGVLPAYREFAHTGQIEISTTPFYHPILPLVCDSDIAAVSHPGVTLPQRFRYPADARAQLQRARSYMWQMLGVTPDGLWPSEGSVSDDALALAAECGFSWAASDNGVLSRTLNQVAGVDLTYQAYVWRQDRREIRLLFRDRYLSDLIGFEYSRMGAAQAAEHFLGKIRENTHGRDALVPIVLDGENAWEYFEANGRPFLRELYRRISDDPELEAVTVSEALARVDPKPLDHVFPGSWINSNFDIWIGASEDNKAWELLLAARRAYDEHGPHVSKAGQYLAYEELLIAEGSDWCWWYGPEHGSDNRPEFDELYRDHLANVYRAMGLAPPEALGRPILENQEGELRERPSNALTVQLDGEVTTAFEWMGAGRYRPDGRSGAMHGGAPPVREMFYGVNGQRLFVRLDGASGSQSGAQFGVEFDSGPVAARVIVGRIVEMEVPRNGVRFRVTIARDGLPPATLPAEGWIDL